MSDNRGSGKRRKWKEPIDVHASSSSTQRPDISNVEPEEELESGKIKILAESGVVNSGRSVEGKETMKKPDGEKGNEVGSPAMKQNQHGDIQNSSEPSRNIKIIAESGVVDSGRSVKGKERMKKPDGEKGKEVGSPAKKQKQHGDIQSYGDIQNSSEPSRKIKIMAESGVVDSGRSVKGMETMKKPDGEKGKEIGSSAKKQKQQSYGDIQNSSEQRRFLRARALKLAPWLQFSKPWAFEYLVSRGWEGGGLGMRGDGLIEPIEDQCFSNFGDEEIEDQCFSDFGDEEIEDQCFSDFGDEEKVWYEEKLWGLGYEEKEGGGREEEKERGGREEEKGGGGSFEFGEGEAEAEEKKEKEKEK